MSELTIKDLRDQSGMTRPQFAEFLQIPYRTVQAWELGDRKCPDYLLDLIASKLSILTRTGSEALAAGEITPDQLDSMYKMTLIKKASKVGSYGDTFGRCFERIPAGLFEKLSPEDLAALVDAFYDCYQDGRNNG